MFSKRKGMDGGRDGGSGARGRKQLPMLSFKNIKDVFCDPVVKGKCIERVLKFLQYYRQTQ